MVSKLPFARCDECPLLHNVAVPPSGPLDAEVIMIGEAPGGTEEAEGKPFVGQSGALLEAAVEQAHGEFDAVYLTNVVACRPPGNRTPTSVEVECCRPRLLHELSQTTGKKVVTLGKTAHEAFDVSFSDLGTVFERGEKYVMPNWHPAYVLRSTKDASEFIGLIDRAFNGPFEPDYIKQPEWRWITSLAQLQQELADIPDGTWVAFDIETDQVQWYDTPDHYHDSILMLQLNWRDDYSLVISDEALEDEEGIVEELQKLFNRVLNVGQNSKFDCIFLKTQLGLDIHQHFDTMLAHYTLNENSRHGLKFLARHYFGLPDYEAEVQTYLRSPSDTYSKVDPEILAKYGAMDALVTRKFRELFDKKLREQGLYEWPFMNILMEAANKLVEVEIRGMQVDVEQLETASHDLQLVLDRLNGQIREMVGEPDLNPNSTQQLSEVLFKKLKLPIIKNNKIKAGSTNHAVLEKLEAAHPVIPVLLEQRRVQKMKSSYVENLRGYLDLTGRVHADFSIPGTEVSRLAVREPALQTIPRPSDYYGALIRSSFIVRDGMILLVCDFSQAEIRIYACISGDPFLLKVYQDGRDLHTEVAQAMYGPNWTKEQRVRCKMFNFSYIYGGNEYSFAQDQGLKIDVARKFVNDYNALMPVGLEFKRSQFRLAKTQGYVTTRFGRVRRFPLITSENSDEVRKSCVHMPCASSASDLTLMSANQLVAQKVPVVLTVHDSVLAEVPFHLKDEIGELMVATMSNNGSKYFPEVPWQADLEARSRWADPLPLP